MHRTTTFVTTLCAGLVALTMTPRAHAQNARIITCESSNGRVRQCRIPAGSQVRLLEQRSAASCRLNSTWGVRDDYIWVDRGCRGRFTIAVVVGGGVGGGYGGVVYRSGRDHDHDYDHDHDDDDRYRGGHGGGYGGVYHRGDHRGRGMLDRAEDACVRRAYHARLRVNGFGDWSHVHGHLWVVDMWVRGRTWRHRVRCEYDRHRDVAWLEWR